VAQGAQNCIGKVQHGTFERIVWIFRLDFKRFLIGRYRVMRRRSIVLFGGVQFLFITSLAPFAPAESYARVCVATIDAESNEAPLSEKSSPAAGMKLVVHLDANSACTALIVPLVENGRKLANGWRPQMVELAQWDEKILPDSRKAWAWNKGADPFELWIFFFDRDAPSIGTFRILVAAMESPTSNEKTLAQQTTKLYEALGARMSGTPDIIKGPKAGATLIGGAVRSSKFPWRDYAQKVVLNDAFEGALVVRHGR